MLYFENDYSEGAHEEVLKRLTETNMEQLPGYGTDRYTLSAKEKICAACGCPDAEVYFLTGGTQTNQIVISSMLDSHEGVVAAGRRQGLLGAQERHHLLQLAGVAAAPDGRFIVALELACKFRLKHSGPPSGRIRCQRGRRRRRPFRRRPSPRR